MYTCITTLNSGDNYFVCDYNRFENMDAISPKTVRKKQFYSGNFCKAPGCANQSGRDKALGLARKYHRFPGKVSRRRAWLRSTPRDKWSPKKNDRICSDHFVGGWY